MLVKLVWLTLMQEIKVKNLGEVELFVDNKSTIDLAKHPAAHARSKHTEIIFHFLKDQLINGRLIREHHITKL